MKRYRILMIGWECPPHIAGGLGVACFGLARALARRGHQIELLVPRLFGDESEEPGIRLFDVKQILPLLTEWERSALSVVAHRFESVKAVGAYDSAGYQVPENTGKAPPSAESGADGFLESPMRGGYGDHVYQEIHVYAALAALIAQRLKVDLIHAHDWMTYPAGLAARAASGLPLVCHVHATEFDRSGESVNQYVYDLERGAYHACDAIIAVSKYTRNLLAERYAVPERKMHAVHNGVDFGPSPVAQATPPTDDPARDKVVLFLGRMTFQKGPEYFVQAARMVIDQIGSVRFVMAGSGDMYHSMIELAADMGLGRYFHYTGFLDRADTHRIYAQSDLYVMPSVSEPFGIAPLEAMSHGVPVIVSKQSGVSEVIANCVKVDFWNVQAMAASMIRLLRNDRLADRLGQRGLREAQQVTWETAAVRVEEVYATVLNKSGGQNEQG